MNSGSRDLPSAGDFFAANRGGYLWTMLISQRLGAHLAVVFHRLGLSPTAMSLSNLFLGSAASVLVLLAAPAIADGTLSPLPVGLTALAAWQLAYALDCGDGQLARVTGTGSNAGARVDVLCDLALQILLCTAVSAVAAAHAPSVPSWLYSVFAGTWAVNLVTSVMQRGSAGGSLIHSQGLWVRLIKLGRDYGAITAVLGLLVAFAPPYVLLAVVGFTIINTLFLIASIASAARIARRAKPAIGAAVTRTSERS